MRHLLIVVVCCGLVSTACGGDDGDGSDGDGAAEVVDDEAAVEAPGAEEDPDEGSADPAPAAPTELFASHTGVTAEKIRVGVVWSDLDELRDLGLVDINYGDVPLVWQTLIDDVNRRGGVVGREIEMVFDTYNPVFVESVEDMCIRLTQDEQVFAVIGSLAGPAIEAILCFVEQNETPLVAGTHRPDLLEKAKAPWISLGWNQQRRYRALVELYAREGLLEGRLAVFDSISEHVGLTEDVLLPVLDDLGRDVEQVLTSTAVGDEVALATDVETFAVVLEDEEIETLLIVQSQIALGLPLIREAGFEGTILTIDSGSFLSGLGGFDERDPSIYEGAYGPTGFSADDVWAMEATADCVATFNEAHPDIEVIPSQDVAQGEPQWASVLLPACGFVEVFTAIAEAAGVDLNPDTFEQAAFGLDSFVLPGQPFNSLRDGKLDANDGMGLGVFDASIGEFGGLDPITPYISVAEG